MAALAWRDVIANPEYQSLSSEDRVQAQEDYFVEAIAPNVDEADQGAAWGEFYNYAAENDPDPFEPEVEAPVEEPGVVDIAGSTMKRASLQLAKQAYELPETVGRFYDYLNTFNPLMDDEDREKYSATKIADVIGANKKAGEVGAWINEINNTPAGKDVSKRYSRADAAIQELIQTGNSEELGSVMADPKTWIAAIGEAVPSLAAMYASGGSLGFAMWLEGAGQASNAIEFEEKTGEKIAPEEFTSAVLQAGAINGLLEKFGFDRVFKAAKPGGSVLKEFGKRGATEAFTELAQNTSSNAATKLYIDPEQSLAEGSVISMMGGFGAGGTAGGAAQALTTAPPEKPVTAGEEAGVTETPSFEMEANPDQAIDDIVGGLQTEAEVLQADNAQLAATPIPEEVGKEEAAVTPKEEPVTPLAGEGFVVGTETYTSKEEADAAAVAEFEKTGKLPEITLPEGDLGAVEPEAAPVAEEVTPEVVEEVAVVEPAVEPEAAPTESEELIQARETLAQTEEVAAAKPTRVTEARRDAQQAMVKALEMEAYPDIRPKPRKGQERAYGALHNAQKNAPEGYVPVNISTEGEKEQWVNRHVSQLPEIDQAAHEAATSPTNELAQPSEAQIEAGNYKKGHVQVQGMDISIENPAGSERSGTDMTGKPWTSTLQDNYGYIKATTGNDKEQVDVFVGSLAETADNVYVVDQVDPSSGAFDEHKIMLGYSSQKDAELAYRRNYSKDWKGMGEVTEMPVAEFKTWVKGDLSQPAAQFARGELQDGNILQREESATDNEATEFLQRNMESYLDTTWDAGTYAPGSLPDANAAAAVGLAASTFKRKVVIFKDNRPATSKQIIQVEGAVLPGAPNTLFISEDAKRPAMKIFGHEFFHSVVKADGETLVEVADALDPYLNPEYKKFIMEELDKATDAEGQPRLSQAKKLDEIYADAMGDAMMETAFWDEIARKDMGMFNRLFQKIRRLVDKMRKNRDASRTEAFSDFNEVIRVMAAVAAKHQGKEVTYEQVSRPEYARKETVRAPVQEVTRAAEAEGRAERPETAGVAAEVISPRPGAELEDRNRQETARILQYQKDELAKGRELTEDEAAAEWVDRYAEEFEPTVSALETSTVPIPEAPEVSSPQFARKDTREYASKEQADAVAKFAGKERVPVKVQARRYFDIGIKKFRQGLLDQFDSLQKISPKAWMMAHLTKSHAGAVAAVINRGVPFLKDNVVQIRDNTKGLSQALQPLGEEVDNFFQWIAANRAYNINQRAATANAEAAKLEATLSESMSPSERNKIEGRMSTLKKKAEVQEQFLSDTDLQALMTLNEGTMPDGKSRFEVYNQARKDFEVLHNGVVDVAVKAHLVNAEEAAMWKEEGFYVPFYREFEGESATSGPRSASQLVRQDAYKRLKGSDKPFADLLTNTLANWDHLMSASLNNQAGLYAMSAAVEQGVAKPVKADFKSKDAVFLRMNGEKNWFEVTDPMVLEALTALNWQGLDNGAMRTMAAFKRALTIGVTASPDFKIKNLIRDSITAIGVAPMSMNPVRNVIQGWGLTKPEESFMVNLEAGGGAFGQSGYIHGNDPTAIKHLVDLGVSENQIIKHPGDWLMHVWQKYQDFGARLENVNRAANAKQMMDKGDSTLEVMFNSRDHLDFTRTGSWTWVRGLAQVVPFLNARLQGMDKLYRAGTDPKQRLQLATVMAAYTALSLLGYMAMRDDEDYEDLNEHTRDMWHAFKLSKISGGAISGPEIGGKEAMLYIPRPFEIGAFAAMTERGLEQMVDDDVHGELFLDRLWWSITETFAMDPTPQLFNPAYEVATNENKFTERPIESMGLRNLPTVERAKPWTSTTAKLAAQGMDLLPGDAGLSPVQIEHLVKGYLGFLGASVLYVSDLAMDPLVGKPAAPDRPIDRYPLLKSFIKQMPAEHTKFGSMFYENLEEMTELQGQVNKYKKKLKMPEKARAFREEHKEKLKFRKRYARASKRLTNLRNKSKLIYSNKTMDPAVKTEKIRILNLKMQEIMKRQVEASYEIFR